MRNIYVNPQGLGHSSPKGAVAAVTALMAIGLTFGAWVSGRDQFAMGAVSILMLRWIADMSDTSRTE